MNSLNVYPSTSDTPLIAGGQDIVLVTLEGALERYLLHGTNDVYIGEGGVVCAIGAVANEVGLTDELYGQEYEYDLGENFTAVLKNAHIEHELRKAAKKAIKLLDKAALRLYPEHADRSADDYGESKWSGPLETLNQELPWPEAKEAVAACYRDAIDRRKLKNAARVV